eukprot:TRINITY_DN1910_c0_g2_i1.p1 TRINITY_DN1910_c0_g2~~TRINITY_DN1910_c0_g2_i1.p1  ORF type:complete len:1306 (-),score=302.23 TRINITY_DN1910_c0_g2_i1:18-3935(-)
MKISIVVIMWVKIFMPLCIIASMEAHLESSCSRCGGELFNHFVRDGGVPVVHKGSDYKAVVVNDVFPGELIGDSEKDRIEEYPSMRRKFKYEEHKENIKDDVKVSIQPPRVDFRLTPLCMTSTETITVVNLAEDEELVIFSVHTDGVQFHQKFRAQKVSPLRSMPIQISFSPISIGYARNVITIMTSRGSFTYELNGHAVLNPYDISPVNLRLPVNTPFSKELKIKNPGNRDMEINEVYTTGGFLHLSLPAPDWTIQPGETKSIIQLTFCADSWGKYQSTLHISTINGLQFNIPIEITVVNEDLILYEEIDFGTFTRIDESITKPIYLLNSGHTPVNIQEITNMNSGLSVDIVENVVSPGNNGIVAYITLSNSESVSLSGKLNMVLSQESNVIEKEIVFRGTEMVGNLEFLSDLQFQIGKPSKKKLEIKNFFSVPVLVEDILVSDGSFSVSNFKRREILPNEVWKDMILEYDPKGTQPNPSGIVLTLLTNVTPIKVPVVLYTGKLNYSIKGYEGSHRDQLDFGNVGVNKSAFLTLNITNPNPIKIEIIKITSPLEYMDIKLSAILDNIGLNVDFETNTLENLEPGYSALLSVSVTPPHEDQVSSTLFIETSNEETNLDITFNSFERDLLFTKTKLQMYNPFDSCDLTVDNNFGNSVQITSAKIEDKKFFFGTYQKLVPTGEHNLGEISYRAKHKTIYHKLKVKDYDSLSQEDLLILCKYLEKFSDDIQTSAKITTNMKTEHSLDISLVKRQHPSNFSIDFGTVQMYTSKGIMLPLQNPYSIPMEIELMMLSNDNPFFLPPDIKREFVLPPNSQSNLGPIFFSPNTTEAVSDLLFIKNNITVLESVVMNGQGGSSTLTLKKRGISIDSDQAFVEIVLVNEGEIDMDVTEVWINNQKCSSGGFKVSPCSSFTIPGSSTKTLTLISNMTISNSNPTVRFSTEEYIFEFNVEIFPEASSILTIFFVTLVSFMLSALIGFIVVHQNQKMEFQKMIDSYKLPVDQNDKMPELKKNTCAFALCKASVKSVSEPNDIQDISISIEKGKTEKEKDEIEPVIPLNIEEAVTDFLEQHDIQIEDSDDHVINVQIENCDDHVITVQIEDDTEKLSGEGEIKFLDLSDEDTEECQNKMVDIKETKPEKYKAVDSCIEHIEEHNQEPIQGPLFKEVKRTKRYKLKKIEKYNENQLKKPKKKREKVSPKITGVKLDRNKSDKQAKRIERNVKPQISSTEYFHKECAFPLTNSSIGVIGQLRNKIDQSKSSDESYFSDGSSDASPVPIQKLEVWDRQVLSRAHFGYTLFSDKNFDPFSPDF